jgi:hypothetical protein
MITTGYKATDENMQCRGLQYVLGEWQEVEGDLELCENGLHFCAELAHTYMYYASPDHRRFKCEVEDVLELPQAPGVTTKYVARRLRLVEEIIVIENSNTGHFNTGYSNTGDYNTGNRNTGNRNTGDCNTGYSNTGDYNTGNRNTGDYNTGNRNTGNRNTGDYNTGNRNTGNRNAGDYNTGNRNTGHYNLTSFSTGLFNIEEQPLYVFDKRVEMSLNEFMQAFGPSVSVLYSKIKNNETIEPKDWQHIPGCTQEALDAYITKYRELHSED